MTVATARADGRAWRIAGLLRRGRIATLNVVDGPDLRIDFIGEVHAVEPGGTLTFGRAADLVVDAENPYLHRILGRFWWHNDLWWLENLGSQVDLEVESDAGLRATLRSAAPGREPARAALVGRHTTVRFVAGDLPYELVAHHDADVPAAPRPSAADGRATTQFGRIELTDDERALLILLAEPCLRDPSAGPDRLPSNRQVALQLDWPITKLNRKLDYLCVRLTKVGVRGLQGGPDGVAVNRRWRLVEHAVAARLVTVDDLRPPAASAEA